MQLGLIGAGRIGNVHLGTLTGLEEVSGVLVADVEPSRAESLAATSHHASAVAIDEVFRGADAVVIASSTDSHAELLVRAAAAGIPAFCEKPIALDLASTREAVGAVDAAGIPVQMGFQRRYDPAIAMIRGRIAAGELGTVYLVRSQTHDPEPPPLEYLAVSGGIFKDCLIHDIDIVRYVTGQEVVSVRAAGSVGGFDDIGRVGDVASASVILEFDGGTLGQLSALRHDPVGYDVRLEVFGANDSLAAGWSERTPIRSVEPGVIPPDRPITSWLDRFGEAFRLEMEGFVRVAAGAEAPAATPRDAYEDLRVATACDHSLAEGRTVYLKEIE